MGLFGGCASRVDGLGLIQASSGVPNPTARASVERRPIARFTRNARSSSAATNKTKNSAPSALQNRSRSPTMPAASTQDLLVPGSIWVGTLNFEDSHGERTDTPSKSQSEQGTSSEEKRGILSVARVLGLKRTSKELLKATASNTKNTVAGCGSSRSPASSKAIKSNFSFEEPALRENARWQRAVETRPKVS